MCGQSVRVFFLFLLSIPLSAHAKTASFGGAPAVGMGLRTGVEAAPKTDLIAEPRSAGSYGHFVAFEPFVDFQNFVLRLNGTLHYHPLVKSQGSDTVGTYNETSEAYTFVYGIDMLLVPVVSESKKARLYFDLGVGSAALKAKNIRTYPSGTNYISRLESTALETHFGGGCEFIFVQNYSLQLELGYRRADFDKITYYDNSVDSSGVAQADGKFAYNANGARKDLTLNTFYGSVALNLHF